MVNYELQNISQQLMSNKSPLYVTKSKYSFFHKPRKKTIFPWLSQNYIDKNQIHQSESIKFLDLFLMKT